MSEVFVRVSPAKPEVLTELKWTEVYNLLRRYGLEVMKADALAKDLCREHAVFKRECA